MQVCEAGSTLAQRCVVVCPCVQYFYNQVFLLFVLGSLLLFISTFTLCKILDIHFATYLIIFTTVAQLNNAQLDPLLFEVLTVVYKY